MKNQLKKANKNNNYPYDSKPETKHVVFVNNSTIPGIDDKANDKLPHLMKIKMKI